MPIILHIDFDSYFASVEQQCRPELRGKPIGVTATNGRTCIIAASREAKRKGVKSPSNVYQARAICPELQLVSADFTKYWELSKRFIAICKDFSPFVEVFSLDELFLDITQTAHLFGGTQGVIEKIKQRIKADLGPYITVSIGVSHNKMLAKMASGLKKPNGVVFVTKENLLEVYKQADLTDICGIGGRIQARLNMMGVFTLLQLRTVPLHSLIAEFGLVEGKFLRNVGLGIDTTRVRPFSHAEEVKSVGRNYCLSENQYDMRVALQNAYELCEEIALKLRRLEKKARFVGMGLYGSINVSVHKTFQTYMDTGQGLFDHCYEMIKKPSSGFFEMPEEFRYIRRISVYASHLHDTNTLPLSLFPEENRKFRLIKTMDQINERFGNHTIRNGFLLNSHKLTTVPNGFGPDTFEKQKLAKYGV